MRNCKKSISQLCYQHLQTHTGPTITITPLEMPSTPLPLPPSVTFQATPYPWVSKCYCHWLSSGSPMKHRKPLVSELKLLPCTDCQSCPILCFTFPKYTTPSPVFRPFTSHIYPHCWCSFFAYYWGNELENSSHLPNCKAMYTGRPCVLFPVVSVAEVHFSASHLPGCLSTTQCSLPSLTS